MRLCSIASGSSGNCIYTGGEHTHLLVDTGISKKRVEEGLKALDIKGEELSGILITHEHIDHVQGLGVFSRKYEVPIYATKGTIEGIKKISSIGKMPEGLFHDHSKSLMMQMNRPDTGSVTGKNPLQSQQILESMTIILWNI